jgi:CBS-domain-containing membrane protein
MSPRPVIDALVRDTPLLRASDTVDRAVSAMFDAALPALPVVDDDARLAGIFGEREFLDAAFPAYLKELHYASFVKHGLDHILEKRSAARTEAVRRYMNAEHVDVGIDYSDVQLAEIFLHHCVPLVPVTDDGTVVGVITRADFVRSVLQRLPELRSP